jgi:uncharacterized damage-inducible protein DinB
MPSEVDDLREHLERYRAVTLLCLDAFSDGELAWRPRPDAFTAAQQFVHIIQSEDFYMRGLFETDWNMDRARFPALLPSRAELIAQFAAARAYTLARLATLADPDLARIVAPPHAKPIEATLRTWLWFVLEHEIHHKAQIGEYLRGLGHVPPYFGMVLPVGARPDIAARAARGGV